MSEPQRRCEAGFLSGFGTVADFFPLTICRRTKSPSFSANFVVIVASS